MKVGVNLLLSNPNDTQSDYELWREHMRLADMVEPLGFDSLWGVEHHFTDYIISPDILQMLSWAAGRTEQIELGTQVVVMPWHDPLRVAEQIALLDNLSDGRYIFGFGRGAARVEFDGFRVPMNEARGRFVEGAEMVLQAFDTGYAEFEGEYIKQPRVPLRPAPIKPLRDRAYAAAISPETMGIIARMGVGMLINPQKPWDTILSELEDYRSTFRSEHNREAPPPVAAVFGYCDADAERAEAIATKYMGEYYASALRHYEFTGDHFSSIKGYEFYDKMSRIMNKVGEEGAGNFFRDLQPWGTPDQCIEKIMDQQKKIGFDHLTLNFVFAHLPMKDVENSMKLFAQEVLPVIKQIEVGAPA